MDESAAGLTDGTRNVGVPVLSTVLPWMMIPSEPCLEAHESTCRAGLDSHTSELKARSGLAVSQSQGGNLFFVRQELSALIDSCYESAMRSSSPSRESASCALYSLCASSRVLTAPLSPLRHQSSTTWPQRAQCLSASRASQRAAYDDTLHSA